MYREQIEHLLGTTIYRRALSYYREGRVIASYSDEGTIDAVVKGSNDNRYRVRIVFDERGNLKDATCSCPYPYYCKHIGAVLLKFLEDREIYPGIKGRNFELPEKGGVAKKREDEIIPLEQVGEVKDKFFLNELLSGVPGYSSGYGESYGRIENGLWERHRFRPVFVLEESWSSLGENENVSGWVVKPYLRYVRRDGTLGRFENFDLDRLGLPINRGVREILSLLTVNGGEKYIDYYIDLFLPESSFGDAVDLYIKEGNEFRAIEFKRIEKTAITFTFSSLNFESARKVPYFQPVFRFYHNFHHGSEDFTTVKPPLKVSSLSRYFFIVEKKSGRILYLPPEMAEKHSFDMVTYRHFISNLLLSDVKYSYSMITELKGFVSSHSENFGNILEVHFPIKQIRLSYISPQPVVDLKPGFRSLEVKLFFKYGERIVDCEDVAELLIMEEKHEELVVAVRNREYEERWIHFLLNYLDSRRNATTFEIPGSVEEFLVKYGERLLEEGFELRRRGGKIGSVSGVYFFAEGKIDWLDVRVELETDKGDRIRVNPLEDSIEGLFLKKGDRYYLLKREDIEKLKSLFFHGKPEKAGIRIPTINLGLIDELYEDFANREDETLSNLRVLIEGLKNFRGIERVLPPANFKGVLRGYQQDGLNWLYFLYKYGVNGILADDMGLGKTVQALALFSVLKESGKLGNVLIVAPVSTLSNWIEEIRRFTPNITYYVHYGQKRLSGIESITARDITLVSYQTLRNDIGIFKGFSFNYLVLDEAQIAKNPLSKVYKALKLINAQHKLALTGTPVENTTVDLWAQMNLLNPGLLGSLSEFRERFAKPIERGGDRDTSELLRRRVRFFILRREKNTVLKELPPKEELVLYATMDTRQRKLYEGLKDFYRERVMNKLESDGLNRSSAVIFEALLRLRQVAILPSLVSEKYSDIPSCKVDLLKIKITEILSAGRKLLIFSQFRGALSLIREWLDSIGIKYSYLDGSTKNREEEIKRFQTKDDRRVFIISLKAGGLGINLTAADYVIIFDPWWNPAVETQAVDRSHRIGQVNRVIIYKLIAKDTIEEKILKLQEEKNSLVKDIVVSESGFFKSLDKDEILSLFEAS